METVAPLYRPISRNHGPVETARAADDKELNGWRAGPICRWPTIKGGKIAHILGKKTCPKLTNSAKLK
jgi:hypothetical protein